MGASIDELAGLLGIPKGDLSVLEQYDDADVAVLTEGVRSALERDAQAIQTGFEEALRFVPRPLRGAAKKVLFPGGSDD